jgi:alkanesulfonate monooxygenase SsuD/methylene tetrahydromethanopterin reductase-like flavin-dependent oxidoreductase (luciferase family)
LTRLKYGCQLPQETGNFDQLVETARACEELGFDSVWVYDHLAPFWVKSKQCLDVWTVLGAIAERTEEIKVGSLVTNVNLRNPALLAKMTSTVDRISNGRLIVGLGTGDRLSRVELTSHGYRFHGIEERVGRLGETILVLKAMWTQERVFYEGKYYRMSGAINLPKPLQKPGPPVWVGGKHQRILDVVAELADAWNYWNLNQSEAKERVNYLSDQCRRIGRDQNEIIYSWSGSLATQSKETYPIIVQRFRAELAGKTDPRTAYFIASLGPNANTKSYEAFADAVASLD